MSTVLNPQALEIGYHELEQCIFVWLKSLNCLGDVDATTRPPLHQMSRIWRAPALSTRVCRKMALVGAPLRKKVTVMEVQKMFREKKPVTMVTAYTYPSAVHVDTAEIDILLVGDSLGMVELGYDTTLPVTMEHMIYHCQAVARGAQRPLLLADMPFGSYEQSSEHAYNNAIRFLKEAGMDAIKLEGGEMLAPTVKSLVQGGVAVMGHIGLTPQRISVLGGFRAQGRTLQAAKQLIRDAQALQEAGAFALLVECVPPEVAQAITESVSIPTIGIGAGPHVSGQVLVYHDLLGMMQHAHHAKVAPMFVKRYANVGEVIQKALEEYKKDVETGVFPGKDFSPYKMLPQEAAEFKAWIKEAKPTKKDGEARESGGGETIKVY